MTGVQTCALPIFIIAAVLVGNPTHRNRQGGGISGLAGDARD